LKAWPTAMTVAMVQGKMPAEDADGQRGSAKRAMGARAGPPLAGAAPSRTSRLSGGWG